MLKINLVSLFQILWKVIPSGGSDINSADEHCRGMSNPPPWPWGRSLRTVWCSCGCRGSWISIWALNPVWPPLWVRCSPLLLLVLISLLSILLALSCRPVDVLSSPRWSEDWVGVEVVVPIRGRRPNHYLSDTEPYLRVRNISRVHPQLTPRQVTLRVQTERGTL